MDQKRWELRNEIDRILDQVVSKIQTDMEEIVHYPSNVHKFQSDLTDLLNKRANKEITDPDEFLQVYKEYAQAEDEAPEFPEPEQIYPKILIKQEPYQNVLNELEKILANVSLVYDIELIHEPIEKPRRISRLDSNMDK